MTGLVPPMTDQMRADANEATKTLYMLADQVGVRCRCGLVLHGHDAIHAVSFMAPMGSDDFQAQPHCENCARAMQRGNA